MRFEGFYASFSPSFHPLTHCSFAYSQCDGYVLLWPALLFYLPGLFASFFSPIGFLWCSHTSYRITFYFLLPLSVDVDTRPTDTMRVVHFTPPGSACSIVFGTGMGEITAMTPGSVKGLHLVVDDIDTARSALVQRGVAVGEITDVGGVK